MLTKTPPFTDPYFDVPKSRESVWLSNADWEFLRQLDPSNNKSRQITIRILLSRLILALKQKGITQYDPTEFRAAVGGLSIMLGDTDGANGTRPPGGTTTNSDAGQAACGNDRQRTLGMAQQASDTQAFDAGVKRTPRQPLKGKRAKREPTKTS